MLADGARLPLADGAADAVVLVNCFLFPAEVDRVLAPDGVVVWVNSSGGETPIHLPPEDVDRGAPGPVGGRAGHARASGSGAPCAAPPNVGFPMTRIKDLLETGRTLSFEFFPPKNDEMERQLEKAVVELAELQPSFVSVTYGALGSSRERTRDAVTRINAEQAFPAMPHLTCVGHTRADIAELLDQYAADGIENILALGGDPPADGTDPGGEYEHASELVAQVREHPGALLGRRGRPPGDPPALARSRERPPLPRRQARRGRLRHHPVLLHRRRLPAHGRRARTSSAATSPSSPA